MFKHVYNLKNNAIFQTFKPRQSCKIVRVHVVMVHISTHNNIHVTTRAAALAQWVRAFVMQVKGWVFESHPRQTLDIKTYSDSSTAKRSAIRMSVTGPRR